eukprot:TRINITY_DN1741_c0_g2_i1.p3 TRINITY_DN1741_c0_g2~~TRINITY_DN1741_c0_g2_i1.p3  ORF type:complete len:164 (+),score=34.32 TRINITY_DN1741_c0_g2_i1:821-1312(+)
MYCKAMKFEQKPDYAYLKGIFRNLAGRMKEMGIEYDWVKMNLQNQKGSKGNDKNQTLEKLIQKEIQEKLKEKDNKPLQITSTQITQNKQINNNNNNIPKNPAAQTGKQSTQKPGVKPQQGKRKTSIQKQQETPQSEQFKLIQAQQQNKYAGPKIAVSKASHMK